MDWFQTTGGPPMLLPASCMKDWGGIDNVGGDKSDERNAFMSNRPSDYDRACACRDWADVIAVGNSIGIVLGGPPAAVAIYPDQCLDLVVGWETGENNEVVERALEKESLFTAPIVYTLSFVSQEPDFFLFDSSSRLRSGDWKIQVRLPIGRCQISVYLYSDHLGTGLSLYRFATADGVI